MVSAKKFCGGTPSFLMLNVVNMQNILSIDEFETGFYIGKERYDETVLRVLVLVHVVIDYVVPYIYLRLGCRFNQNQWWPIRSTYLQSSIYLLIPYSLIALHATGKRLKSQNIEHRILKLKLWSLCYNGVSKMLDLCLANQAYWVIKKFVCALAPKPLYRF